MIIMGNFEAFLTMVFRERKLEYKLSEFAAIPPIKRAMGPMNQSEPNTGKNIESEVVAAPRTSAANRPANSAPMEARNPPRNVKRKDFHNFSFLGMYLE